MRTPAWFSLWLMIGSTVVTPSAVLHAGPAAFQPPAFYRPLGLNAADFAVGDLDGDGALDVAVVVRFTSADGLPPTVRVLRGERFAGRPTGRFGAALAFNVREQVLAPAILAGAFVDEERSDVVFATYDPVLFTNQFLNTVPGNPLSALTPNVFLQTQIQPGLVYGQVSALASADFNRDGILDVIVGYGSGDARLEPALGVASEGVPTGHFVRQDLLFVEGTASRIVAADLDGDAWPDVASTLASFDRIEVDRGLGNGRFERIAGVPTGAGPRGLAAVDLDQDGLLDLVAANSRGTTVSVMMAGRNGPGGSLSYGAAAFWSTGARPLSGIGPHALAVADWNLDGHADLAVANHQDSTVAILLGRGDGGFGTPSRIAIGARPEALAAADLDADGAPDLLVLSRSDGLQVHLNAGGNRDPDCSAAVAVMPYAWPPNGRMLPIEITGVTDPDGDPVTITVTGVTQDEPVEQGGRCPDAVIIDGRVSVRSERRGSGDGRVYAIQFEASDGRGGGCSGSVSVCVPHDQGNGPPCVDGGQVHVSTDSCGARGFMTDPEPALSVRGVGADDVRFDLGLAAGASATLSIYDITGRRLALMDVSGSSIEWARHGRPPGLYFAELRARGQRQVVRFLLSD